MNDAVNIWKAPEVPVDPATQTPAGDPRRLASFEDLVGKTITAVHTIDYPTGMLLVCGEQYLKVAVERGYDDDVFFGIETADIREMHKMGFISEETMLADQEKKAAKQAATYKARELEQYHRLRAKLFGGGA